MEDLLHHFNLFFDGVASAEVKDNRLVITIEGREMEIALPQFVGFKSPV